MEILIQMIQFKEGNPLPYVPAHADWNDHVAACVQCAHVDQLAANGEQFSSMDLCEGGSLLQVTVQDRIRDQHEISLRN